jgi:archaellum biogenesis ATPase FlaH
MRHKVQTWRDESQERLRREEDEQAERQYREILSWLKSDDSEQLAIFDSIAEEAKKFPGTCGWILQHAKVSAWLRAMPDTPFIWLQGNPGTGKSVLASQLIAFLLSGRHLVFRHFCAYSYGSSTKYDYILRSILLQILYVNRDLAAHVYQECILGKKSPSTPVLEQLLQKSLASISDELRNAQYVWIVLDGLDECEPGKQQRLIVLLDQVSKHLSNEGIVVKVLISSRFSPVILRRLRKKQTLSLTDEAEPLTKAIQRYASQRLRLLGDQLRQLELDSTDVEEIEHAIAIKADGMFLYARLVLDYLSTNIFYSGDEMKTAVQDLPPTLSEFYQKILTQILARLDNRSVARVRSIFGWVAFAVRTPRVPSLNVERYQRRYC